MGSCSRLSSTFSISALLALLVSCGGGGGPRAIAPLAVTTDATRDRETQQSRASGYLTKGFSTAQSIAQVVDPLVTFMLHPKPQ